MIVQRSRQLPLAHRVAAHLGTRLNDADRMVCPQCGCTGYGPNQRLSELEIYEGGYLPGAPLLVGVCLGCDFTFEPAPTPMDDAGQRAEDLARSFMLQETAVRPGIRFSDLVAATREHVRGEGLDLCRERIIAVFWGEVQEGRMTYSAEGRAFRQ